MGNGLKIPTLYETLVDYATNSTFVWLGAQRVFLEALKTDIPSIVALPVLACRAVNGDAENAFPIATAWTALRYAAIFLDAVQDKHAVPNPLPNVPHPQAVSYATGLIFEAMKIINDAYSSEQAQQLGVLFARTGAGAAQGQAQSLSKFSELEAYWQTTILKSGSIFQAGLAGGAIAGQGSQAHVTALGQFGLALGVIRQLYDDCRDGANVSGSLISLLRDAGDQNPAQTIAAVLLNWQARAFSHLSGLESEAAASLNHILDAFVTKARLHD